MSILDRFDKRRHTMYDKAWAWDHIDKDLPIILYGDPGGNYPKRFKADGITTFEVWPPSNSCIKSMTLVEVEELIQRLKAERFLSKL